MKSPGRKPYFSKELERAIATAYLVEDIPSRRVAEIYGPMSPTKKLSEAGVRRIAKRYPDLAAT
jgi:hypothetical protein